MPDDTPPDLAGAQINLQLPKHLYDYLWQLSWGLEQHVRLSGVWQQYHG